MWHVCGADLQNCATVAWGIYHIFSVRSWMGKKFDLKWRRYVCEFVGCNRNGCMYWSLKYEKCSKKKKYIKFPGTEIDIYHHVSEIFVTYCNKICWFDYGYIF